MRKKDLGYTVSFIAVSHILITVLFALIYGLYHPFFELYKVGNPLTFILAAVAVVIPIYALFGFFFILAKDYLYKMEKTLLIACILYMLILIGLWFICVIFSTVFYNWNIWSYYVFFNYPSGIIYNSIDITVDGDNLLFLLTAVVPAIAFYTGAMIRLKMEKKKVE